MSKCKYQGQIDSSCGEQFCECGAYAKSIGCEYQEFDYNLDGRINIVTCGAIGESTNTKQTIETPNCSECEHYEDHHTSLACAKCPVITKSWGGSNYGID